MRIVAVALVILLGAACSPERAGLPSASRPSGSPGVTATDVSEPPTPTPTARPQKRPVTLAFAGDVHFEGVLGSRLADAETALAPVTHALARADLAMVNLETAVGRGGRAEPGKRFPFQAPPTAYAALAAAGVDVATMANNHALDYGRDPLPGTFSAMKAARSSDPPLAVVGLGRHAAAAFRPAMVEVRGVVVAAIGATVAGEDPTADPTGHWAATPDEAGTADALDPRRLLRAVRRADRAADVVVTYLHWGIQGERCPTRGQRTLAADLVRAGADVIVGSHAHVLQGDGRLGVGAGADRRQAYVAYGLGNYAWYTQDPASSTTGVLTLTVRPPADRAGAARVTDAAWAPARIGADGLPRPLPRAEVAPFHADRAALRGCAGLAH